MKLGRKMLIPIIVISLVTLSAFGRITYTKMEREVNQIYTAQIEAQIQNLEGQLQNSNDLTTLVLGKIDEKNLALSRALAEIVRLDPENMMTYSEMVRLAKLFDVDEVHVIDENGVLNWGNIEAFYGFDFNTSDQTKPFLDILSNSSLEIAQEPQPNGASGQMFQYIGVARTDAKGLVQVGIDAEVVRQLSDILDIQNNVKITSVGNDGFAAIVADNAYIAHRDEAKIGQSVAGESWLSDLSGNSGFAWLTVDNSEYFSGYSRYEDNTILVFLPRAEYFSGLDSIRTLSIVLIAISTVVMVVVLFFCIRQFILRPIKDITSVMEEVSHGKLNCLIEQDYKGEFGILRSSINSTLQQWSVCIADIDSTLSAFADDRYDVSVAGNYQGDFISIKDGLNKIIDKTNSLMRELQGSAEQVSSGSHQIAQASQTLASGSSQQAEAIERLSATIAQIQTMAEANSQEAITALEDNRHADTLMNNSIESMQQMLQAMRAIEEDSQNITKVIKVIDDIAFQTNILALNASVEAARAGMHGKGFAVVADEVRNLASKSSDAAKETSLLIADSVKSVAEGNSIVEQVSRGIAEVAEFSQKNAASIQKINDASLNQNASIDEVANGISQISFVVQANSATAEETAASAEELSAQSNTLNNIVARFQLRKTNSFKKPVPIAPVLTTKDAVVQVREFALEIKDKY